MTVPSTARRAGPYNGNGVTTTFSFGFKTFAAGDLQVTRTSATGIETTLVLNSDYSVSLNGDQDASPGGTITYPLSGSPLAAGQKLTIVGDLDYEQTTDLLGGGAFNARVIEDTFDRTVIQIQQLEERLDRALVAPVSDTPVDMTMPTAANRANRYLSFDATGKPISTTFDIDAVQNASTAAVAAAAAAAASQVAAASSQAAAQTQATFVANTVAATTPTVVNFNGDGATVAFTLPSAPGAEENTLVFIGGVYQQKSEYSVSGTTLTFTSAPPAGTNNIEVQIGPATNIAVNTSLGVSFLQAGTGAVTRSVQSRLRDVVSVFDFMTAAQIADVQAGTASLDASAAIQAAINAANQVYFPKGIYRVQSTINTKSDLTLIGESRNVVKLLATGDFDILRINSSNNLTIENLTFIGSLVYTLTGVGCGLHLTSGLISNLVLKKCNFEYLRNGIKFDTGTNLVVGHWEFCEFLLNQEWQYECTGEVNSLLMLSCRYKNSVLGAIRAQGFTAINCAIESLNGNYAIDTINQPYVQLIGCHFEANNTLADVFVGSGGNVRFERCNFTGPYTGTGALLSNFYNVIVGATAGQIEFHQCVFASALTARYLGAIQCAAVTTNPIIFAGNNFLYPNGNWLSGLGNDAEYLLNNVRVNGHGVDANCVRTVTTTNATPALPVLLQYKQLGLAASALYLMVNVTCVSSNGAEAGAFTSRTLVRWDGANQVAVGTANETPIRTNVGLSVTVTADPNYVYVQVTGLAATNIKWTVNYSIVEAAYLL